MRVWTEGYITMAQVIDSSLEVLSGTSSTTSASGSPNVPGVAGSLSEAEAYVDSIMAPQRVIRIDTDIDSGIGSASVNRKRHLSLPSACDTATKKPKNNKQQNNRAISKAKRTQNEPTAAMSPVTVSTKSPVPAPRASVHSKPSLVVTAATVHNDADTDVKTILTKISTDMLLMWDSLTERMNSLESNLEQRLTQKVANLLDKRINTEMKTMKRDIDERMSTLRADVCTDIDELSSQIADVKVSVQSFQSAQSTHGKSGPREAENNMCVILRNLPQTDNENVMNEVNRLIKDGLQIKDVTVSSADRKASDTRSRPGVVVAVFRSVEAKQTCMDKKAKLRDNNRYRNVYLHHHQSREERLMASNFRTVLDAIQNNRSDITLRGSRVIRNDRDFNDRRRSSEQGQTTRDSD